MMNKPSMVGEPLPRRIAVLGSTGSVGTQALDVARAHGIPVDLLSANADVRKMEAQAREFSPRVCVMADDGAARDLRTRLADTSVRVESGADGILQAIYDADVDAVVNSILGAAGLRPTLACLRAGRRLALSNKESLVIAGDLVMQTAKETGTPLLPVDSEHSAIFRCLAAGRREDVRRILLTASGGPFFGKTKEELARVTPAQALAHPTWKMGAKITVDSATLMNKGFEVIEASHLFGVPADGIRVVVHRESIIHSAVEYIDNTVIAQMSVPDMRECVQYALTYPACASGVTEPLDLARVGKLTFFDPDTDAFPLLSLAYDCLRRGGLSGLYLNASNEVAVEAFLAGKIGFTDISDVVFRVTHDAPDDDVTEDRIGEADAEARRLARAYISKTGVVS